MAAKAVACGGKYFAVVLLANGSLYYVQGNNGSYVLARTDCLKEMKKLVACYIQQNGFQARAYQAFIVDAEGKKVAASIGVAQAVDLPWEDAVDAEVAASS